MRRLVLTTTASALVFALAPASALAHKHHHKRHHARTHHARVRHLRFGDVNTPPTTPPATTPTTPPSNVIGTIASDTNGTLVIQLNDGTTLTGMVTNDTEVECQSSMTSTMTPNDGGGDNGGGDNQGPSSGSGDHQGSGDSGQGDDDQNENENNQQCTTANLTQGANVTGAELKVSSDGSVWEKIDLSH